MDFGPIDELARLQRGLVTHQQLADIGLTPAMIRHRRRTGQLVVIHRGIYRLAGVQLDWGVKLQAAALAAGPLALVSHRSAAVWRGFQGAETTIVDIASDENRRIRLAGVVAHQTLDLPSADWGEHGGLPVTSVERTLIDVGRYWSPETIGILLDHAVRDGLTSYERFQRRTQELARQGRNGIGTARLVLAARGFGDGWGFEKAMRGALRDAGLPEPQREFRVRTAGSSYRVDFAYCGAMVGIECDSTEWHTLPYQRVRDARRRNRIQNAGLMLLLVTSGRLRDDPDGVIDEIRTALVNRAGLGSGPTATFPDAK